MESLSDQDQKLVLWLEGEAKRVDQLGDLARLGLTEEADLEEVQNAARRATLRYDQKTYGARPPQVRDVAARLRTLYLEAERRLVGQLTGEPVEETAAPADEDEQDELTEEVGGERPSVRPTLAVDVPVNAAQISHWTATKHPSMAPHPATGAPIPTIAEPPPEEELEEEPLVAQLERAEVRSALAESELSALRDAAEGNERFAREMKEKAEAAERGQKEAEAALAKAKAEIAALGEKVAQAEEQAKAFAMKNGQLAARAEVAERSKSGLEDTVKLLTREIQQFKSADSDVAKARKSQEASIRRLAEVEVEFSQAEARAEARTKSLEESNATMLEQVSRLERRLKSAENLADTAASKVAELKSSEDAATKLAESRLEELDGLKSRLRDAADTQKEQEQMRRDLNALQDEVETLRVDAGGRLAADERAAVLEERLFEAERLRDDLEVEASGLKAKLDDVSAKLEEAEGEKRASILRAERAEQQAAELNDAFAAAQSAQASVESEAPVQFVADAAVDASEAPVQADGDAPESELAPVSFAGDPPDSPPARLSGVTIPALEDPPLEVEAEAVEHVESAELADAAEAEPAEIEAVDIASVVEAASPVTFGAQADAGAIEGDDVSAALDDLTEIDDAEEISAADIESVDPAPIDEPEVDPVAAPTIASAPIEPSVADAAPVAAPTIASAPIEPQAAELAEPAARPTMAAAPIGEPPPIPVTSAAATDFDPAPYLTIDPIAGSAEASAGGAEPIEVAEAAEVAEPVEVADVVEVAEAAPAVEVAEAAEVAEPVEVADVIEVAEVAEPVDVVGDVEVAEPIEVAEVVDVAEVAEPIELAEAVEPIELAEPIEVAEAAPPEPTERPSDSGASLPPPLPPAQVLSVATSSVDLEPVPVSNGGADSFEIDEVVDESLLAAPAEPAMRGPPPLDPTQANVPISSDIAGPPPPPPDEVILHAPTEREGATLGDVADPEELYDDALDDMVSGDAERAVQSFLRLIELDPDNDDYRSGLELAESYVLKERGEQEAFTSRFERALDSEISGPKQRSPS